MRDLAADVPTILTAALSDPPDTHTIRRTLAEVWKDGAEVGRRATDWDYNTGLPPVGEGKSSQVRESH